MMVWNRELKKLLAAFIGLSLAGAVLVNLCMSLYAEGLRKQYYEFLSMMIGNVAAMYPDVAEEDLIRSLNDVGNEEVGRDVLEKYGLFGLGKDTSTRFQERNLTQIWIAVNFLFLLLLFFFGLLFALHLSRRHRRIAGLVDYMETLNRGIYKLELEDNDDDELSGLRNEIYKLTVMLKEQAKLALEQRRALADSVTNISHQLKTPLTSVSVLIDNLSENADMDGTTRRRFLAEITRQIAGMSWLITVMMKLSRLEAGVVELECEHFEVKPFVEEAVQRLEMAAEWKQVSFRVKVAKGTMLAVDRKWTGEALMNLIKNAIEHSPEGGCVEISGEENDIYTQIVVRDHGPGILKEERERLFRRFYNGKTAREDSTGIGLALAKEIVEKQEGSISVDSKAGQGTVFVMRFLKQR